MSSKIEQSKLGEKLASHPKPVKQSVPATESGLAARKPSQIRSRARFSSLLDATSSLLAEQDVSQFGLYDIAKRASVPPASAYHFFPTKEAAVLALAQQYLLEMGERAEATIEIGEISSWSDLIKIRAERTVDFYNSNPVAAKIFLSGSVMADIRALDLDFVSRVSELSYGWLNRYFVMPYVNDHQTKFSVVIAIFDGVWMTSYGRHRRVTEGFAAEASRAAVSYCRTFLPEVIEQRPPEDI